MSDETPHHFPMCVACETSGGYAIKPGGTWYPPQRACAPYDDHTWFTDTDGRRTHQAWPYEAMCPVHAHELTERIWRDAKANRAKRGESGMTPHV